MDIKEKINEIVEKIKDNADIKEAFEKVPDTSVYRLYDTTNGFVGVANISDFIVYKFPCQYFIECKSVHGNVFPLK